MGTFVFGLDAACQGVFGYVDDLLEIVGVLVQARGDPIENLASGVGRASLQTQIRGDLAIDGGDLGQRVLDRGKQAKRILDRARAPILNPMQPVRIRRGHNKLLPAIDERRCW
ncbi:hypothetical protein HMPREF0972_00560 [Actinomyces sp. oral taxon 848 str. F0332]|nr:hypothetical protein HMPREF0972_00560 [Actinomyces sp. oral taxon 848 str. F0332]